jgi:hypothetical protein
MSPHNALTKQELKDKLASKENKLAEKLLKLIKSNELSTEEKLLKLSDQTPQIEKKSLNYGQPFNSPDIIYKRDPSHPRSKYRIVYILDSCFEHFICKDTIKNNDTEKEIKNLTKIFELFVQRGFRSGESAFRGNLNQHILNTVFYSISENDPKELFQQNLCIELSKILIKEKRIDIDLYAGNSYLWVNSIQKLEKILSLGAKARGSNLIDCAINYIACSPQQNETPKDRIRVLNKLLSLGSIAEKPLEKRVSGDQIKKVLQEHGLLGQIEYQINSQTIKNDIKFGELSTPDV